MWKVGGSCAVKVGHGVMGWAGQVGGGNSANWDIAVLQASCTGAEKKGFTELESHEG